MDKTGESTNICGSFRDPCGFVFRKGGVLYRRINREYAEHYGQLLGSGLYAALIEKKLLVPHEEVPAERGESGKIHKIIKPELIKFISWF